MMQVLSDIKEAFSEFSFLRKSVERCVYTRRKRLLENLKSHRHGVSDAGMSVLAPGLASVASYWDDEDYSLDRLGLPVVVFDNTPLNDGDCEVEDSIQRFFEVI